MRERLSKDARLGIRTEDVIARSLPRLPLYGHLNTFRIDTAEKDIRQIAEEIQSL